MSTKERSNRRERIDYKILSNTGEKVAKVSQICEPQQPIIKVNQREFKEMDTKLLKR